MLKLYSIYVPHLTEYIYQKGLREFVGVHTLGMVRLEASCISFWSK